MAHTLRGASDFATSVPARPPALERLVIAPEDSQLGPIAEDATTMVVSEGALFRQLLVRARPVLVAVFQPPATAQDTDAVIAERRRRRELRAILINAPALINDRLSALRAGFDEALGSDVDGRELAGRFTLLADAARADGSDQRISISPDLTLDSGARELRIGTKRVHLRPREAALLEILAREPGRTFTREQLLDVVAPAAAHRDVRTVDVHIRWLRAKLELERHPSARLVTVRGVGYRLDPGTPARRRTSRPPLVDESQSPLTRR